jgi:hypothetical protein
MKRLTDLFYFAAVVAGGFVAQRAFGADAAPAGFGGAADALQAIAENPIVVAFLSWFGAEAATRLLPTRKKRSTLFLFRNFFRFVGAACLVAERVCNAMAESDFAQVRRKPRRPKAPDAATQSVPEPPKDTPA